MGVRLFFMFFYGKPHLLPLAETAREYLMKCSNIKNIFAGHYYTEKVIKLEDKKLFLCPASCFQIDEVEPTFKVSSYDFGWREIVWDGVEVTSRVRYV